MLFTISVIHVHIFLYETGPIQWMFSQHCGYWWLGALAAGHSSHGVKYAPMRFLVLKQGSHRVWKTWKTWKNKIFWKSHGKSWNFEKSSKVMEKSWNFENPIPTNHSPALEISHWWVLPHLQCHVFRVTHLNTNYKEGLGVISCSTHIDVWFQHFIDIWQNDFMQMVHYSKWKLDRISLFSAESLLTL